MNRRTFVSTAVGTVASSLFVGAARAQAVPRAKNVVLIHGLFADGSCWSEVIVRLQAKALQATAVQNPLTTLQDAVAATRQILAWQQGPTVLVAHSFGGMILTEAGVDPKVSAVVYVAARAANAGEARLRCRRPTAKSAYPRCCPGSVQTKFACGQNNARGMALEAEAGTPWPRKIGRSTRILNASWQSE